MADAHIVLTYGRDAGIVAIAGGEQYRWAHTALEESGFRRHEAGIYRLPGGDEAAARATVAGLIRCSERHRTSVSTSSRPYIGDAARDIARLLPGRWDAAVEIYSHPVWQEDLAAWLWDSGELTRAVQSTRIPYAATLTESVSGTTLLLAERPGHQHDYLLGALPPKPFGEGHGDRHAPASIILPPFPGRAAKAITERFLPAYDWAVHDRRTATVTEALDRIHTEHDAWTTKVISGWYSDASPLGADALDDAIETFLDKAWPEFLSVMQHAPALLDKCRPAATAQPNDTHALARLADSLAHAETLDGGTRLNPRERRSRTWTAISTWLTYREPFLRQVRAAASHRPSAPAVSAPSRALPPGRPAPRR
ncbi:hypothetical protein [Streptomyces sp. NRRL B-24572]|uniref:hypothetical protein n=1 Tax=Streptomyces sp. NRRL B-24572 TaxID=1962156 RepID=UPI000A39EEAB|nr:hypothetical protein [Streptomyces sp. NRRL B-24572]